MEKYDVVIVGSGIGGLCCGSILALSGKKVLICEAHNHSSLVLIPKSEKKGIFLLSGFFNSLLNIGKLLILIFNSSK